jgi:hypothetical protein
MRSLRLLLALVLSLALNLTVTPSAQAWFFNPNMMIPDADMYWAPEPAPPVKTVPAPAPAPKIPAPPAPAPVPAPVAAYTPPQSTYTSSLLRRLPPEDVYVAPAPAPAPRQTAAPAPVVQPVVIEQPRQVPNYDPVNDAIIIGGGRTYRSAPPVDTTPPRTPPSIPSSLPFPGPSTQTSTNTETRADGARVTTTTVTTTSYVFDNTKPVVNRNLPLGQSGAEPLASVQFNLNKDSFVDSRSAQQKLADSILAAAKAGNTVMQLEGHASPEGSYSSNQKLSEQRADKVRDDMSVLLRGLGWDCGGFRSAGRSEASSCSAPDGSVSITLVPVAFGEKFADTSSLPAGCNINVSAGNSRKCENALSEMRKTDIFMTNPPSVKTDTVTSTDVVDPGTRPDLCPDGSPKPCPVITPTPTPDPTPTPTITARPPTPDPTLTPDPTPTSTRTRDVETPRGTQDPQPEQTRVPRCPNGSPVPCPEPSSPPPLKPPVALCDIPNGLFYSLGFKPGDGIWGPTLDCPEPKASPTPTPSSTKVRPS